MYLFNASAIGLAGAIRRPTENVIENQASVTLGPSGGAGSVEVKDFDFKGIVSFHRAFAQTSGSYDPAASADILFRGLTPRAQELCASRKPARRMMWHLRSCSSPPQKEKSQEIRSFQNAAEGRPRF